MLRAVGIPRLDFEEDHLFSARSIACGHPPFLKNGVALKYTVGIPDLDPLTVGIVHRENESLWALREVTGRNELSLALEVDEGK